jgi:hypothetical protein
MTQGGLVLIKRYSTAGLDAVSAGAMRRVPSLKLDALQVLLAYRGLDGHPWPQEVIESEVVDGFASLDRLDSLLAQLRDLGSGERYDLLYCMCADSSPSYESAPAQFQPLGLDFGFYRGDDETYSILFHEIIFGRQPDMRTLAERLNEHLLLPDTEAVKGVELVRQKLLLGGADLENSEGGMPRPFWLFGYTGGLP